MNHLERKEWRMKMEIIYLWWKLEVWWGFIRGVKENGPCICSFIKLGVCLGSAWLASIGKHHLFLWPYVKTRVDHKCVEHPPLWTQHLEIKLLSLGPYPVPHPFPPHYCLHFYHSLLMFSHCFPHYCLLIITLFPPFSCLRFRRLLTLFCPFLQRYYQFCWSEALWINWLYFVDFVLIRDYKSMSCQSCQLSVCIWKHFLLFLIVLLIG